MITYVRTDSTQDDFRKLVEKLDALLRVLDGDEHFFYAQLNKTDTIRHVIVAYVNDTPVGCGAIRHYSDDTVEIKRMFVPEDFRNKGIASGILIELETWASELNYKKCILETGNKQVEALKLYPKCGYSVIENFGQYKGVANSVCFEKVL